MSRPPDVIPVTIASIAWPIAGIALSIASVTSDSASFIAVAISVGEKVSRFE
ncbi:hypothetical protein [Flaviflexus ciconiae]|uniref:hypothetical protein n=1 Tax=Flaviflexus ciconiae TaxID=2496867 RepID=UPI0019CF7FEB|nr:hypothetical protein [Flaviflexus ciconiae]